jgi:hypothetical protein
VHLSVAKCCPALMYSPPFDRQSCSSRRLPLWCAARFRSVYLQGSSAKFLRWARGNTFPAMHDNASHRLGEARTTEAALECVRLHRATTIVGPWPAAHGELVVRSCELHKLRRQITRVGLWTGPV